jgi:hypothetical protein
MSPERGQRLLRRRLGPLAVLARGAGLWSVILMADERCGSGTTITGEHREVSQAVSEAIRFAIANPGVRRGQPPQLTREEIVAAVEAGRKHGEAFRQMLRAEGI